MCAFLLIIADALKEGAAQFEENSSNLKRKYWWQNIKVSIDRCFHCNENMALLLSFVLALNVAWHYV